MLRSVEMQAARQKDFYFVQKIIPEYFPKFEFADKKNHFELKQEKIAGATLQNFLDQFENENKIRKFLRENLNFRNQLLDLIWASKKVAQISGGIFLDFFSKKDGLSNIIIEEKTQKLFFIDPGPITFYAAAQNFPNKIFTATIRKNMEQEKNIQKNLEKLCDVSKKEKKFLNLKYQI